MQYLKRTLLLSAALFLYACSAHIPPALAQDPGIQNEDGKTLASSAGTATKLATDAFGKLFLSTSLPTSPLKQEDNPFTSGDAGSMCLGVKQNSSPTTHGGTSLDYTPLAVNSYGDVYIDINANHRENAASSPVQFEDASLAEGTAVILAGARRIDTLATNPGTDGDAGFINQSSVGALYTEPANKAAVFASATIAEASITNSFASALSNSVKLVSCTFTNATDGVLAFDDGTNEIISALAGNATTPIVYVADFGVNGRFVVTSIRVKYLTNPSTGTLYINCYS